MNPKSLSLILNAVVAVGPKLKGWLFADGKFSPVRAFLLLLFFVAIGVMSYFLGTDETATIIGMMDDVSDLIGYVK